MQFEQKLTQRTKAHQGTHDSLTSWNITKRRLSRSFYRVVLPYKSFLSFVYFCSIPPGSLEQ